LLLVGSIISAIPVIVLILASIYFFNKDYKQYRPSLDAVNFKHSKVLISLGGKFFIIQIAGIVIFSTSNFIIAQVFGPAEVSVYNIAFKLFSIPIMVFSIVISPFWSAFTEAFQKQDYSWIKRIMRKLNLFSVLLSSGIIVLLMISKYIYRIWLGDVIQIPFILSLFMAIYAIIIVLLSPFTQFLNGISRLALGIRIVWLKALLFIPLAIILSKTSLGISGIIAATCILNFTGLLLEPIQYKKIINRSAHGIWDK
jgi:O-antigen/teichoic acid export membrane protein